jgi:hypothetical protein
MAELNDEVSFSFMNNSVSRNAHSRSFNTQLRETPVREISTDPAVLEMLQFGGSELVPA